MSDRNAVELEVAVLHALVGEEAAVVAGLLSTYLNTLGQSASQLTAALAMRDSHGVCRAAHVMKSPSLCVGALLLGQLCGALEEAARAADWPRLDAVAPSFEPVLARTIRAVKLHIDVARRQVPA